MAIDKHHAEFATAVAKVLQDERNNQGVGLRELSRRTGINTGNLSLYLNGKRVLPLSTLNAISDALGLDALTISARTKESMKQVGRIDP